MKKSTLLYLFMFIVIILIAQQGEGSTKTENWSCHYQITAIKQEHPSFTAAYSRQASLINESEKVKLNHGQEGIIECDYSAQLANSLWAKADYQFINNPAYNRDRGPVKFFWCKGAPGILMMPFDAG